MDYNRLHIDLTSKNNLFVSVENQGTFIHHRFGKRQIPVEHLSIKRLKKFLTVHNTKQVILDSVFGDPTEYKNLQELLDFLKQKNIDIVCITNGVSDNIKILKDYNAFIMFKLYGFTNTYNVVTPDINFKKIYNNLKYCDKIQYHVYKQNASDISEVYNNEFGIEVEFVGGPHVGYNINHIFTEEGKWLHDVNTYEIDDYSYERLIELEPKNNLHKTMEGFNLLKTFLNRQETNDVLSTVFPLPDKSVLDSIKRYGLDKRKKEYCISFKGHFFESINERNYVTNAYIKDWCYKELLADVHLKPALYLLSKFHHNTVLI